MTQRSRARLRADMIVEDRAYIGVSQGAKRVEIYELHFEFETPELYDSTSIRAVLEREIEAKED